MAYRLFVGNLPMDIKEREVDDLFYKYLFLIFVSIEEYVSFQLFSYYRYGRIRDIDLKTPSRPPAYAFITYDDVRDAEDAIRARYEFRRHIIFNKTDKNC